MSRKRRTSENPVPTAASIHQRFHRAADTGTLAYRDEHGREYVPVSRKEAERLVLEEGIIVAVSMEDDDYISPVNGVGFFYALPPGGVVPNTATANARRHGYIYNTIDEVGVEHPSVNNEPGFIYPGYGGMNSRYAFDQRIPCQVTFVMPRNNRGSSTTGFAMMAFDD